MERQRGSKVAEDGKILWKKNGGGSAILRIDGNKRRIKPGETFLAYPEEIPLAFRDVIVPLDGNPIKFVTEDEKPVKVVSPAYTLRPRGNSKTWWDVVDAQGKVLNEKGLTKEIAERFKADLEK